MAIKFLNTVQVDTDVLYVDASSNRVGIGTTSPSTVLEISSTGVNGVDISQSASNASQSGRLFFTTNTASEGFALFNSNGTFQVNSGGIPNNTSGTNRISIIGSSGNVGIGTTSPSTKLHVSGGDIRIDDTERIEFGAGGVRINNDAAGRMYYNAPLGYYWQAGSGYKMVLLNSGDVGIGTTSPSARLDVVASGIGAEITSGQSKALILRGGSNSQNIQEWTTTSSSVLAVVNSNGYFGIGTTSPSYQLQVTGDSSSSPLLQVDDDGDAYLQIKPDASTIFKIGDIAGLGDEAVIVGSYGDLRFNNSGSTTMTVSDLNRVGIGATSPQEKLHVMEEVPGDTLIEVENTRSNSTAGVKLSSGVTNFNTAYTNANGDFEIYNSTTNRPELHIGANGKVGIDVTSPSEKLQVGGNVKADNYINQRVAWNVGFLASSVNTSSYYYIPVGYLSETTSNQYYNNWVASYAGRVRKIVMRNLGSGSTPTATTINFRITVNGTVTYTGGTITVTGSGLNQIATHEFNPGSSGSPFFNATDRVQVAYRTNGLWQYAATSISLEYTE